ncbi:cobaltochelatase subunit CobN, partial [Rhizobium johnstonii]
MHLLLAQQGTISDGEEAIDLGQTPGDILFLSAADSELAAIAAAHRDRGAGPSLRLASLMSLKHPMSVDTYVERTARHAKLIIVRALGGASYFHYALEALHAAAARAGALIAVLPGDARPDAGLVPFSNIDLDDLNALWAYLIEGGDANARAFLDYAEATLSGAEKPAPAVPLMKAGIWWPGRGLIGVEEWRRVVASLQGAPLGVAPPSVLPDISPTRGEIRDERSRSISSAEGTASSNVSFVRSPSDLPISPLVGEMSGRTEG